MSKTIAQAEAALASANTTYLTYLNELQRESERSEGSGAQERRREERQQKMLDKIADCERDLEEAKRNQLTNTAQTTQAAPKAQE